VAPIFGKAATDTPNPNPTLAPVERPEELELPSELVRGSEVDDGAEVADAHRPADDVAHTEEAGGVESLGEGDFGYVEAVEGEKLEKLEEEIADEDWATTVKSGLSACSPTLVPLTRMSE
jgi:hypothetical protein